LDISFSDISNSVGEKRQAISLLDNEADVNTNVYWNEKLLVSGIF